jgi:hypothetical protein
MANVVNKTTGEFLQSVNTPDFSESEWLINPDISTVRLVPNRYWKVVGTDVVEMSMDEKAAVDASIDTLNKSYTAKSFELKSPDGSIFSVSVGNDGSLVTAKV